MWASRARNKNEHYIKLASLAAEDILLMSIRLTLSWIGYKEVKIIDSLGSARSSAPSLIGKLMLNPAEGSFVRIKLPS